MKIRGEDLVFFFILVMNVVPVYNHGMKTYLQLGNSYHYGKYLQNRLDKMIYKLTYIIVRKIGYCLYAMM